MRKSRRRRSLNIFKHDPRFPLSGFIKKKYNIDYTKNVLIVKIFSAKSLRSADPNGYSDPYVILDFHGKRLKTAIKKRNLSPTWNETFIFSEDKLGRFNEDDRIFLQIKDHDLIGFDDHLGSLVLSLKSILESSTKMNHDMDKDVIETISLNTNSSVTENLQNNELSVNTEPDKELFVEDEPSLQPIIHENNSNSVYFHFKPTWFTLSEVKGLNHPESKVKIGFEFHPANKENISSYGLNTEPNSLPPTINIDKKYVRIRNYLSNKDLILKERPTLCIRINRASYFHSGKTDTKLFVRLNLRHIEFQTKFKAFNDLIWNETFEMGYGLDYLAPSDMVTMSLLCKTRFGSVSEIATQKFPLWRFMTSDLLNDLETVTLKMENKSNQQQEFHRPRLSISVRYHNPFIKEGHSLFKLAVPIGRVQFYSLRFRPIAIRNIELHDSSNKYYGFVICGKSKAFTETVSTTGFPIFNTVMEFSESSFTEYPGLCFTDSILFQIRRIIKKDSDNSDRESESDFSHVNLETKSKVVKGNFEVIASVIIDIQSLLDIFGSIDDEGMTLIENIPLVGESLIGRNFFPILKAYFNIVPIEERYYKRKDVLAFHVDSKFKTPRFIGEKVEYTLFRPTKKPLYEENLTALQNYHTYPIDKYCGLLNADTIESQLENTTDEEKLTSSVKISSTPFNSTIFDQFKFNNFTLNCKYRKSFISVDFKPVLGTLTFSKFEFLNQVEEHSDSTQYRIKLKLDKQEKKIVTNDTETIELFPNTMHSVLEIYILKAGEIYCEFKATVTEIVEIIVISRKDCKLKLCSNNKLIGLLHVEMDFIEHIFSGALATTNPNPNEPEQTTIFKGLAKEISRFTFNISLIFGPFGTILSDILNWRSIPLSLGVIVGSITIFTLHSLHSHILFMVPLSILILLTHFHLVRYKFEGSLRKKRLTLSDTHLKLYIKAKGNSSNHTCKVKYSDTGDDDDYVKVPVDEKNEIVLPIEKLVPTVNKLMIKVLYLNLEQNCCKYHLTLNIYKVNEDTDMTESNFYSKMTDVVFKLQNTKLLLKQEMAQGRSSKSIIMEDFIIYNVELSARIIIVIEYDSITTEEQFFSFISYKNFLQNDTSFPMYSRTLDSNVHHRGNAIINLQANFWAKEQISKIDDINLKTKTFVKTGNEFDDFNNFMLKEDCWQAHPGKLLCRHYYDGVFHGFSEIYLVDILEHICESEMKVIELTLPILNSRYHKNEIDSWIQLTNDTNLPEIPSPRSSRKKVIFSSKRLSMRGRRNTIAAQHEDISDLDITTILSTTNSSPFGTFNIEICADIPKKNAHHRFEQQEAIRKAESINIFDPSKAYSLIQSKLIKVTNVLSSINDSLERLKNLFSWVHPQKTQFLGRLCAFLLVLFLFIQSSTIVLFAILFMMTEYFRPKGSMKTKFTHFMSLLPTDEELRSFYDKAPNLIVQDKYSHKQVKALRRERSEKFVKMHKTRKKKMFSLFKKR